jgi:D-alanyl-D-alanine dipeptidase
MDLARAAKFRHGPLVGLQKNMFSCAHPKWRRAPVSGDLIRRCGRPLDAAAISSGASQNAAIWSGYPAHRLLATATLAVVLAQGCASDPAAEVYRIEPLRSVAELRQEALASTPPAPRGDERLSDLVELVTLDPTIHLDIRYASDRNFLGEPVYTQARAFLQRPAAEALVRAHRALAAEGYGVLVHDGYRPWYVTKMFWEATPPDKREFVADPAEGSKHNRGCAVDLTLYDVKTGKAVEMPSLYDEMSARAYADYSGGTARQRELRDLLRKAMEAEGFTVLPEEWWHFDYRDWQSYGVQNVPFERLGR